MPPKTRQEKDILINETKKVIQNTESEIEKFFLLINKEYTFENVVSDILDFYPDGNNKARSVINAWLSVYNYCVRCHYKYINYKSGAKDIFQSFDAINATILNNAILKHSTKINTLHLDNQSDLFQDVLNTCYSARNDLVEIAQKQLNVLFNYKTIEENNHHIIISAFIGKESVKFYDETSIVL